MKKISILLIAILFLFTTTVSAKIIHAEKEGWYTFVDEVSGLMIDFPESFEGRLSTHIPNSSYISNVLFFKSLDKDNPYEISLDITFYA